MQPLISPVDHETRRSSFQRAEEDRVFEDTPLINRFPNSHRRERYLSTIITVGFLLGILLAGFIIGVYLLILQSNSDNILPPVEDPIPLLSRGLEAFPPFEAQNVVVLQTDTRQCVNRTDCIDLLTNDSQMANQTLLYNYLVSSNGLVFEALGWKKSTLYAELSPLVVAFIGNFEVVAPSILQIAAAKNVITNAVVKNRLKPTFIIIGKTMKYPPNKLFEALSKLPQWRLTYN
ncbi:peptidoglycan-recognition protein SB2 [Pieris rapae]|uniref:peptidoglycan-recognition protein SB2 n=1 Tax=Pieris rapae TaxID=64459 RepID=UPI001E281353|nr:peptidoglycan-recognition protein SB2 [Pieris rapae]